MWFLICNPSRERLSQFSFCFLSVSFINPTQRNDPWFRCQRSLQKGKRTNDFLIMGQNAENNETEREILRINNNKKGKLFPNRDAIYKTPLRVRMRNRLFISAGLCGRDALFNSSFIFLPRFKSNQRATRHQWGITGASELTIVCRSPEPQLWPFSFSFFQT